jgi:hypothetical protein
MITSLAPFGVINLVRWIACVLGVNCSLPFKSQFLSVVGAWVDFPLIDQLDIVSRICSFSRSSGEAVEFPVLMADALFKIHSNDGKIEMRMDAVCAMGGTTGINMPIKLIGVGSFFDGVGLKFADAGHEA